MRPCPHCFAQVNDQVTQCPECGEAVPTKKRVPVSTGRSEAEKWEVPAILAVFLLAQLPAAIVGGGIGWWLGGMVLGTAGKLMGLVIGVVLGVVIGWILGASQLLG